jgi:hypothetical protein
MHAEGGVLHEEQRRGVDTVPRLLVNRSDSRDGEDVGEEGGRSAVFTAEEPLVDVRKAKGGNDGRIEVLFVRGEEE